MGALIGGIIAVAIGVWLWIIWPGQAIVLQGSIPIMLIAAGLLAIIAGITSIKDTIEAKKLEKEAQQSSSSSNSSQQ
jgi:ABC-type nickel/cobalt efflux system permease component RcnA